MYEREILIGYLFGRNSGKKVPVAIKTDPLVVFVKEMISQNKCPFCKRKFGNRGGVINHLEKNEHKCGREFDEFIELTLSRYRLVMGSA